MTQISRTARFAPNDTLPVILADLACPACGRQDPRSVNGLIAGNRIRLFCDACGAFVTIALDDEQAQTIARWAAAEPRRHQAAPR
jgi:hypothetical protein